jgi:hypothetical protein
MRKTFFPIVRTLLFGAMVAALIMVTSPPTQSPPGITHSVQAVVTPLHLIYAGDLIATRTALPSEETQKLANMPMKSFVKFAGTASPPRSSVVMKSAAATFAHSTVWRVGALTRPLIA